MKINFLKSKRIMIFLSIAVVISAGLIFIAANAIGFMGDTINTTSDLGTNGKSTLVRFNFDKLKEIGIIKD